MNYNRKTPALHPTPKIKIKERKTRLTKNLGV